MSTKNKVNPVSTLKGTWRNDVLGKRCILPFYLSGCAFHNSRLNFASHFGNKIIASIEKICEIIGCLCGKINAKREKSDKYPT